MKTYFISDGAYVKIGRSNDPTKRLRALQTSHHAQLTLLLALEGDSEREFHVLFSKHRHRGEWFVLTNDILTFIESSREVVVPSSIIQEVKPVIQEVEQPEIIFLPPSDYTPSVISIPPETRVRVIPDKLPKRIKLSSDDILQRFDANGGKVYHYKGDRKCYATTIQIGTHRFQWDRRYLIWARDITNRATEMYTLKDYNKAVHTLAQRAKALPAITPKLADIEQYLEQIDAHTFTTKNEIHNAVNQWCSLIEIGCRTKESAVAFSSAYYNTYILPIFDRYAEGKPEQGVIR